MADNLVYPGREDNNAGAASEPGNPPEILSQPGRAPGADSDADRLFFTYQSFTLIGAASLPEAELRALWKIAPGGTASVGDIFRFADAITAAYRARGYLLGFAIVPAQDIRDGVFGVRVIEGQLDRLQLGGDQLPDEITNLLQRRFDELRKAQPLTQEQLERFLLLINEIPGLSARAVLRPGQIAQSTDLELETRMGGQRVRAAASNYLSASLGREIASLDIDQPHALMAGDQLSVSLRSAPDASVYRFARAGWQSPPNDSGSYLLLDASQTNIRAKKGTLAATGFASTAENITAQLVWPARRSRSRTLDYRLKISQADSQAENSGQSLYQDRLVQLEGRMDVSQRPSAIHSWSAGLASVHGLATGQTKSSSRSASQPHFHRLQMTGQAQQILASRPAGQTYLSLALEAQIPVSRQPLPAEAECSFGGRYFGSGFEAGTLGGEACLLASLRLGMEKPGLDIWLRGDAGQIRQRGQLGSGEKRSAAASSLGVGSKLQLARRTRLQAEAGRQWRHSLNQPDRADNRLYLSLSTDLSGL